jgi:hypothetical protein
MHIPTTKQLDSYGKDAGAVLDAIEMDLQRELDAWSMEFPRRRVSYLMLRDKIKRVRALRKLYFLGDGE